MKSRNFRISILVALMAALSLAACSDPPSGQSRLAQRRDASHQPPRPEQPVGQTGAALFRELCMECHRVHGQGGAAGPDLTRISLRANRGYMESMIREPARHFPGTGMPSFEARLTPGQIGLLADYLNGVK